MAILYLWSSLQGIIHVGPDNEIYSDKCLSSDVQIKEVVDQGLDNCEILMAKLYTFYHNFVSKSPVAI